MGRIHAEKLVGREDVELCVLDPAGVPEHLPAVDALPARLDAAIIAVPARSHADVALPLLRRGVACLIEKPLAVGEDVALLERFDRLTVGHIERFNPALAALPDGVVPRFIRSERLASPGRRTDVDVVMDLMIHDLDLVLHLAGEVVEVRAIGLDARGKGIDAAEVWLETETGCVATVTASRVSRSGARTMRVVDEAAYWSLDLGSKAAGRVPWRAGDLAAEAVDVPDSDAVEALHDAFLGAVRGERPFPVPAADGARAVRLAERVLAAIADR
ncbi:MAG: Gfo/Idh/MocA family oxidoreductase [Proteobacteria bacterium]|nr:Gfo/Idh/MocA family oxidoreductase [Pseudomonadota bacterium]MCP4920272.1 Gfo/Idh/MocA family oxidoreductase [Pseudomonadota bacterium]